MILNLGVDADESTDTSTPLRSVQAGNLQPWMLLYLTDHDQAFVVAGKPDPYQQEDQFGRTERWVRIPVHGNPEPMLAKATGRVDIVVGAAPGLLQPLLDDDLYDVEQEALARNGLCSEQIHDDPDPEDDPDDRGDDEEDMPLWCGLPSDPDSALRLCPAHDLVRRQESDELVEYGFEPTYGIIAGS